VSYDAKTFQFYADNAQEYASRRTKPTKMLSVFLAEMVKSAAILELGCGAGLEAQYMQSKGFDVTATEGNPELAKFAVKRLGDSVKIMRFDELADQNCYDGIWANMCLLHAPWDELDAIIGVIHNALKPNGLLMASFKVGDGAKRDRLERYYNLPTKEALLEKFSANAPWTDIKITPGDSGVGHDGAGYNAVWVSARR